MIWANGPCLKCVKYIIAIQCRLHYNMEWAMQRKYQFITKGEYIQYIVAILILTLHRQGSGCCVVAASCICFWVKLFVLLLTSVLVDYVSMCHRTCGDVLHRMVVVLSSEVICECCSASSKYKLFILSSPLLGGWSHTSDGHVNDTAASVIPSCQASR